jgi:hypothetical protein
VRLLSSLNYCSTKNPLFNVQVKGLKRKKMWRKKLVPAKNVPFHCPKPVLFWKNKQWVTALNCTVKKFLTKMRFHRRAKNSAARQQSVIKVSLKLLPDAKLLLFKIDQQICVGWRVLFHGWRQCVMATAKILWGWRSLSNIGCQVYPKD